MADILAGIAPQKDTYANWVTLNPTLGKTSGGNDYSQMIFATGSPVGDILIWGMAQSFTVAYGLGQFAIQNSSDLEPVPNPPYDISVANTLIAVPTITGYAQKYTYYWTGGDGSNTFKFVTGVNIGGIDSALWVGEGEGHITIESDGTNYQVREYEDSGSVADSGIDVNRVWKKSLDGELKNIGTVSGVGTVPVAFGHVFITATGIIPQVTNDNVTYGTANTITTTGFNTTAARNGSNVFNANRHYVAIGKWRT